jgi:hypothetical protein
MLTVVMLQVDPTTVEMLKTLNLAATAAMVTVQQVLCHVTTRHISLIIHHAPSTPWIYSSGKHPEWYSFAGKADLDTASRHLSTRYLILPTISTCADCPFQASALQQPQIELDHLIQDFSLYTCNTFRNLYPQSQCQLWPSYDWIKVAHEVLSISKLCLLSKHSLLSDLVELHIV